jgi:hypothetical protein
MPQKREPKPKLSDAERHKRFLDTAREVEASDDPKDFDRAFNRVVTSKGPSRHRTDTKK